MKDTLHSSPEIKALMALTWDGRLTLSSFSEQGALNEAALAAAKALERLRERATRLAGLADALRRIANGPGRAGGWRRVAEWCQDQAREALNAAGMEA